MRFLKLFSSVALLMTCVGCANNVEKQSVDEEFIANLRDGLISRWNYSESQFDDSPETWEGLINCELEEIKEYKDKGFENKNLGKQAKLYIQNLEDTLEITKYASDYEKWNTEYYNDLYLDRVLTLYNIDNLVDVTFADDSNQDDFDVLVESGKEVYQVDEILNSVNFDKSIDEYGDTVFTANVENTSDFNFEYFSFDIQFTDNDGIVTNNEIASTENWESGTVHKFEFSTYYDVSNLTLDVISTSYTIK